MSFSHFPGFIVLIVLFLICENRDIHLKIVKEMSHWKPLGVSEYSSHSKLRFIWTTGLSFKQSYIKLYSKFVQQILKLYHKITVIVNSSVKFKSKNKFFSDTFYGNHDGTVIFDLNVLLVYRICTEKTTSNQKLSKLIVLRIELNWLTP